MPEFKMPADSWRDLYHRAVNVANGLTNYVEDRPELRSAERDLAKIEAEARALSAPPAEPQGEPSDEAECRAQCTICNGPPIDGGKWPCARFAAAPAPQPAGAEPQVGSSACGLTECRGKPKCKTCRAMDRMDAEALAERGGVTAPQPASTRSGEDAKDAALRKLAAFGAWAAEEFRDSLADVDGGSAQDAMERFGVIVKSAVTEPCGEGCVCVEYGDFPHECFKFPADVRAAIDAARGASHG